MATAVRFSRVCHLFRLTQCRCQSGHALLRTTVRRHHTFEINGKSANQWSTRHQRYNLHNVTRLASTQFQISEKDFTPISEQIGVDPSMLQQVTFTRQIAFIGEKINMRRPFNKMHFYLLMKFLEEEAQVNKTDARLLLESTGQYCMDIPEVKRAEFTRWVWDRLQHLGDEGVKGDVNLYNIYLRLLLDNKDPLKPTEAFEEMAAKQLTPNRITYLLLISSACETGDMEEASKLLQQMKNLNMPVSIVLYNSLIRGYCKAGDIDKAMEMFKAIGSVKLEANDETYANLILCHAERADIAKIKEIVEEMETAGITLNMQKFLETVAILANTGHTKQAEQVLDMVSDRKPGRAQLRLMDTLPTMVSLLNSGHGELAFKTFQLLTDMHAAFFYARALAANLPLDQVVGFVRQCKKLGYKNSSIGSAVIAAGFLGETDAILDLYKHLEHENETPTCDLLSHIIRVYKTKGDTDGLVRLLPLMERMGHWEYTRCLELLYSALRSLGKTVEEAMKLLKKANTLDEAEFNTAMIRTMLTREPLQVIESEVEKMKVIECCNCSDGIQKILIRLFFRAPEDWQRVFEFVVKVRDRRKYSENCFSLFNYTRELFNKLKVPLDPVVDFMIQNNLKILSQQKQIQVPDIDSQKLEQIIERYQDKQGDMKIEELQMKCPDHILVYRHNLIKAANKGERREVETILQSRRYPADMVLNYSARLALIEMYSRIFSDSENAMKELKLLREIKPDFAVSQWLSVCVAQALCKDAKYQEALDVLSNCAGVDKTRHFDFNRQINKLLTLLEGTGEEKRFWEILREKSYITAEFESKLDRPLQDVLGSEGEIRNLSMDKVQNIFQTLIKKENKAELQNASDMFSKHKSTRKVLHRLAAAFAVEDKTLQARKVLQTPGLTTDTEEIENICSYLRKERAPLTALENYHSVLKSTIGRVNGQEIVLFAILRRLVDTDLDKAVEFLEMGFEEHGSHAPRSAYNYVAKALENAKRPVPFTIPPFYQNTGAARRPQQNQARNEASKTTNAGEPKSKTTDNVKVDDSKGKTKPTAKTTKVGASKPKAKATDTKGTKTSEVMEAPVSDIIEKAEEIKDITEHSDPAKEIMEKTEPKTDVLDQKKTL